MMSKPRGDRQVPPGVREISRDSLNDLVTLLASEGLPIEDVAEPERRFFAFFNADGATVGYGGLERADGDMLLRSVVTTPKEGRVRADAYAMAHCRGGAKRCR